MVVHLNPQVLKHGHALGIRNSIYRCADFFNTKTRVRAIVSNRDRAKRLPNILNSLGVLIDPGGRIPLVLNEHGHHRREHPCIGSGLHSEVNVSHFRRLRHHRIDNNHGFAGIFCEVAQKHTCSGDTVGMPGVLSKEKRDITMVEVTFDHGSEHLTVDPKLTGLLLRQSTGAVDASQY